MSSRRGQFAVIFVSTQTDNQQGYGEAATLMEEIAASMPGYCGIESVRGEDGLGITVSYWESEAAIAAFRAETRHRAAQANGRSQWYERYAIHTAQIVRSHSWQKEMSEEEKNNG